MKNKTLRTNSMKLKKVIAASLAISVLFAFTGCGNSLPSAQQPIKTQNRNLLPQQKRAAQTS